MFGKSKTNNVEMGTSSEEFYYLAVHIFIAKCTLHYISFQLTSRGTWNKGTWLGRVTYTGLAFKEQWSTIISGRKSSLKEAMLIKICIFLLLQHNEGKLIQRSECRGKLQIAHLLLSPLGLLS